MHNAYPTESIERQIILNPKDFNVDGSFPFYFEKLIVAQNEKYFLGTSLTNGSLLNFNSTIENELSSFFQKKMPPSSEKLPLIIKVNRIMVSTISDYSSVDLSLTFYTRENNSFVEILQTSAYTNRQWAEVLNKFERQNGKNILAAFKICFLDLQSRYERGSLRNRFVSIDNLTVVAPFDETSFPILSPDRKPRKGVFYNFSDFIDLNSDSTIHFFEMENNSKFSDLKYIFRQPVSSKIWGGFDGEKYFFRITDRFFKLEIIDGKLFFILNDADRRSLLFSDRVSIGLPNRELTVIGRTGREFVYRARLDWYSGQAIQEDLEVFILNNTTRRLAGIDVYLDGKKIARLENDEYFKIDYVPPRGLTWLEIRLDGYSDRYLFDPMRKESFFIRQTKKGVKIAASFPISDEVKGYILDGKTEIDIGPFR
jgi:hypothetical protein